MEVDDEEADVADEEEEEMHGFLFVLLDVTELHVEVLSAKIFRGGLDAVEARIPAATGSGTAAAAPTPDVVFPLPLLLLLYDFLQAMSAPPQTPPAL